MGAEQICSTQTKCNLISFGLLQLSSKCHFEQGLIFLCHVSGCGNRILAQAEGYLSESRAELGGLKDQV